MEVKSTKRGRAPSASGASPPSKKVREDSASAEAADALSVAQMYDRVAVSAAAALQNRGRSGVDPLAHLRPFNNWVKRSLIAEYCAPGSAVLDLACGRGGDLFKIVDTKPRLYVGSDISRVSLEEAVGRINEAAAKTAFPPITLIHADLGQHDLAPSLLGSAPFDTVQCQLALHYFFQSRARATNVFKMIAAALKPGGYFVGTTMDADVVAMLMRQPEAMRGTHWKQLTRPAGSGSAAAAATKCVGFENAICRVKFDAADDFSAADDVLAGRPQFGTRYSFQLGELIEADCDEYLAPVRFAALRCRRTLRALVAVLGASPSSSGHTDLRSRCTPRCRPREALSRARTHPHSRPRRAPLAAAPTATGARAVQMALLRAIGAEAGLQLIEATNLHDFYEERAGKGSHRGPHKNARPPPAKLFAESTATMPAVEWETVRLYTTFVFQRARCGGAAPPSDSAAEAAARSTPSAADLRASDIISLF